MMSWPATLPAEYCELQHHPETPLGTNGQCDQAITRLRPQLARVPGANLFLQAAQDAQIGGRMGNGEFQYTLQGDNLQDLLDYAPRWYRSGRRFPISAM